MDMLTNFVFNRLERCFKSRRAMKRKRNRKRRKEHFVNMETARSRRNISTHRLRRHHGFQHRGRDSERNKLNGGGRGRNTAKRNNEAATPPPSCVCFWHWNMI